MRVQILVQDMDVEPIDTDMRALPAVESSMLLQLPDGARLEAKVTRIVKNEQGRTIIFVRDAAAP